MNSSDIFRDGLPVAQRNGVHHVAAVHSVVDMVKVPVVIQLDDAAAVGIDVVAAAVFCRGRRQGEPLVVPHHAQLGEADPGSTLNRTGGALVYGIVVRIFRVLPEIFHRKADLTGQGVGDGNTDLNVSVLILLICSGLRVPGHESGTQASLQKSVVQSAGENAVPDPLVQLPALRDGRGQAGQRVRLRQFHGDGISVAIWYGGSLGRYCGLLVVKLVIETEHILAFADIAGHKGGVGRYGVDAVAGGVLRSPVPEEVTRPLRRVGNGIGAIGGHIQTARIIKVPGAVFAGGNFHTLLAQLVRRVQPRALRDIGIGTAVWQLAQIIVDKLDFIRACGPD